MTARSSGTNRMTLAWLWRHIERNPYPYYLLGVCFVSWVMDWSFIGVFLFSVFIVLIPLALVAQIWDKFSPRAVRVAPKPGDIIRDPRTGEPIINPATGNPYVVPAMAAAGMAAGMALNPTDAAPMVGGEGGVDVSGNNYGASSDFVGSDFMGDSSAFGSTVINPATGLPMVGGEGGVDVMGNPYGMSFDYGNDYGFSNIGSDFDSSSSWSSSSDDYGGFDSNSFSSFGHDD